MSTASSSIRLATILLAAASGLGTLACTDAGPDLDVSVEEIIGGVSAHSAKLNAIGALGLGNAQDGFRPICTGTLITPTIVLTAEHCVDFIADPATELVFLIGPDSARPIRTVPVRGVTWEKSVEGGAIALGIDIAVMHLAEPVTNIALMPYAQISTDRIDQRFAGIGYGRQSAAGADGTRKAGSMTFQSLGGRVYESIYGTFEGFLADDERYGLDSSLPEILAMFKEAWDTHVLLDGEAWFGNGQFDAQTCHGDSGGPITALVNGKTTVFGVASWVNFVDERRLCELGAAYATLEPIALDFLAYETACPLLPREGTCDGATAVRCVPPDEGGYRVTRTDCSTLGQICDLDETGAAACVDDPCEGISTEGVCAGTVATRCTRPEEGPRRLVSTDCAELGSTCGVENGEVACVDPE